MKQQNNTSPLKGRDIIVTGLQPWDTEIGSNCKDIALELSRHNRILYVNYPMDRISYLRSKEHPQIQARIKSLKGEEPRLKQVKENIWELNPRVIMESINKIPNRPLFDWLNKRNNKKLAGEINSAMQELGFEDAVLFNDNDFLRGFYLPEMVDQKLSIYYLRDNLTLQDYFKRHGQRLEKQLMAKSDYVMANSVYLAEYARDHNPHSYYVGQGFEAAHFLDQSELAHPEDVQPIKKPVIGYVGALISLRLDIPLLEKIAENLPEYSLVLVGPEDEDFQQSKLHGMSNVHFLGKRPVDQVPAYIASFDVCINPQVVNYMTIGNYPRKIDEYLVMGKPVVATKTNGMIPFENHTYLCETVEDYISKIKQAIEENSDQKRQERIDFAMTHTWEHSVKAMAEAISDNQ
ncbi:MAG: glycosyltransferase [Bacteroidota bacterium]